jgi:hypothetical protein
MSYISATRPGNPDQSWRPKILPGNILRWRWGRLSGGEWWRFDLVARIADTVHSGDVLINRIEVYGDSPSDAEPDYANNVFELPITITIAGNRVFLPLILRD